MRIHHLWPIVAVGAVWLGAPAPAWAQSPDDLLKTAAAMVEASRTRIGVLVADETYAQTLEMQKALGGSSLGIGGAGMVEQHTTKTTRSTTAVLVAAAPPSAAAAWRVLRDVREVDGAAVKEPATLERAAATRADLDRGWAALETASAAQHLGTLPRDVANPWLAFELLGSPHRSKLQFKKDGDERIGSTPTTRIAFTGGGIALSQHDAPWAKVRGALWIDATGRILRTRLDLGQDGSPRRTRIDVDFVADAALESMVPSDLRERHDYLDGKLEGRATYRNHRRAAGR